MNIKLKTTVFAALAVIATACGGNTQSSETTSDSTNQEIEINEEPQINPTPINEDPDNPILTSLKETESNHFYLLKNGNVGYKYPDSDLYSENGKFLFDNGAYIVVWGMGDMFDSVDLIYGDTRYPMLSLMEPEWEEIQFKFAGDLYSDGSECIKEVMTFDPETKSLKIKIGNEWQSIAISSIPTEVQEKIKLD